MGTTPQLNASWRAVRGFGLMPSSSAVGRNLAMDRAVRPDSVVLDLGTGTGCVLLAILHEIPAAFGVGIDRTPDAAALAARNARQVGLAERARMNDPDRC